MKHATSIAELAAHVEARVGVPVARIAFGGERPDGVAVIVILATGREVEVVISIEELRRLLPPSCRPPGVSLN